MDILERLKEWHEARVGTYPLLKPAIDEIKSLRRQLAVSQDQIERLLSALGRATLAYGELQEYYEKTLQEKEALMPDVQTQQDGRGAQMEDEGARRTEEVGGPKINWVP